MNELTYVGTGELLVKRGDDGELLVYGKATGPDLDLDQQICDPEWLKSAMPKWFATGANVREQHSAIAAGVGLELSADGDDWMLKSEVVDPVTARKVERGVLKGYSIGIKNARIDRSDKSAPNGRIVSGEIVEISLVDRPANPTARIEIAKSVDGTLMLTKSDDAVEVRHAGAKDNEDQYPAVLPCPACNGLGEMPAEKEGQPAACVVCGGSGVAPEGLRAPDERFGNPVDDENHNIKSEYENHNSATDEQLVAVAALDEVVAEGDKPNSEESLPVDEAKSLTVGALRTVLAGVSLEREAIIKAVKHDPASLISVRTGLIQLIKAELDEMLAGEEDETCDVSELLCALQMFLHWWAEEAEEGETAAPFGEMEEMEENESEAEMAYIGLGVEPDLVKAATAADATEEARNDLRDAVRKALGVTDEIAMTKSALEEQEEVIKGLNAALAELREMAAPGGPVLRQTATQALKSADAERMQAEAARMRKLASELSNPTYKAQYLEKAVKLEADANAVLRG